MPRKYHSPRLVEIFCGNIAWCLSTGVVTHGFFIERFFIVSVVFSIWSENELKCVYVDNNEFIAETDAEGADPFAARRQWQPTTRRFDFSWSL